MSSDLFWFGTNVLGDPWCDSHNLVFGEVVHVLINRESERIVVQATMIL